eukprot:674313_1
MSSDDLPGDKPGLFNTFSGNAAPIEAYGLLSPEEAEKNLTDRDKDDYKDKEFELVVRSRIWGELKNSVAERREAYLEREKERNTHMTYQSDESNDYESDHKHEDEAPHYIDTHEDTIDSNHAHNNGSLYADSNHNRSEKEEHEEDTEQTFANPFTPFQHAIDSDTNGKTYAIPFDIFDLNGHDPEDDVQHEVMDHIIQDSNESKTFIKNGDAYRSKARKSEVFADPFHWDTDDENNNPNDNPEDEEEDLDAPFALQDLDIDVNTPFSDPFHGTPSKDKTDDEDSASQSDLFANPFHNNIQKQQEEYSSANNTKNADLLRLLFGENTDNTEQDTTTQFANPFHKNDTQQSDDLPLSNLLPIDSLESLQHTERPVHISPFKIDTTPEPVVDKPTDANTTSIVLTPVPMNAPMKRESAVMQLDTKIFRTIVAETQEIDSPRDEQIQSDHIQPHVHDVIDDISSDGKEDEKEPPKRPVLPPKQDSLDFSWSSKSQDSLDIVHAPTPPPAKTMNDELYELLATLLATFMHNPKAFYLVDGVPWEKWKCMDWPQHITPPHTLTQVRDALDNNEYDTPGQFAVAARNVFRNYTTYHWKGAGQYRVNTRAQILWEEFDNEYWKVLHDESEERKHDESRKRAIDEAQQRNDSREREFSNTHTVTTDLDDDDEEDDTFEEENQDNLDTPIPILKQVSFADGLVLEPQGTTNSKAENDEEIEFAEMAKLHYEMSVHLSTTRPSTPQPPFLEYQTTDLESLPPLSNNPLNTLISQHEMPLDVNTALNTGRITPISARPSPHNGSRRVSMESLGAVSVNSRNVRFQSPGQAQRALLISNTMETLSRTGSMSSLNSIFRKKRPSKFDLKRAALLAKISKNLPAGFNPHQRRGSIIRNGTSHVNGTQMGLSVKSKSAESEVAIGERHRASKELIDDFSPGFKSYRASDTGTLPQMNEMPNLDLDLQKTLEEGVVPEVYAHLKYQLYIMACFTVLLVLYMIKYRLFADQRYPLLRPITNIGGRIMSVFTEALFIIGMLGSMIVVHLQYRPYLMVRYRRLWIAVFVIANVLNILRVSLAHCTMDFIYDLYIYLMIMCTMILPFFDFDDNWKESQTVAILFVVWIGVILIGFVFVILHEYFAGFILCVFYLLLVVWILRFVHYNSLGVFDDIGNLSSDHMFDIGFCCLLIPGLLLFAQLAAAILSALSSLGSYASVLSAVYGYYVALKITFYVARSLWETTALKGSDQSRYIHFMFPIFFIEELLDAFLLIKLKFSWQIIGLLILMAANHLIRDSDIGYRVVYKQWIIPNLTALYYWYHNTSDSQRNLFLMQSRSLAVAPHIQNDENEPQDIEMEIGIEINANADGLIHDEAMQMERHKELNLAQESDELHIARVIIHFQMMQFAEYASRCGVLFVILMDIMCDAMHIGKRLLVMDEGTVNENERGLLVLLCVISLVMIAATNDLCQRLLAREALTSIQCIEKLKCINQLSYKQRLYVHQWVIFGDECEIFKRFWIFFALIVAYQSTILTQAFFAHKDGRVSICNVFF